MKSLETKFFERVDKSGDCWIWLKYKDKDGYGQFQYRENGKKINVKDEVFIEKNGKFEKAIVLGIKQNDKEVEIATNGEFGLEFNKVIPSKSKLWIKNN